MHCNTSNPFKPHLEHIDSLIDPIVERIDLILQPNHAGCTNNPDLQQVGDNVRIYGILIVFSLALIAIYCTYLQTLLLLADMRNKIGNMTENTNICEPRMNRWNQVFHQSVCTEIFNGWVVLCFFVVHFVCTYYTINNLGCTHM
jgi:hypothetical protein